MNAATSLRALIVEDMACDAELIVNQLQEAGYRLQWTRVETEADYLAALDTAPDVILSDYNLPRFSGLDALGLLKERELDIPFILVSGTVGEDIAVAAMVAGARDYVLKDRLARLAPAVQRELQSCALRCEDRRLRSALAESERNSRATFNQAAVGIVRTDLDRNIIDANRKFCELTGYEREELLRMTILQISHPDDRGQDTELRTKLLAGEIDHFRSEKRYLRKDGGTIWVRRTTSLTRDAANEEPQYIIVVEDVTDRKAAEESYRATFDRAPVGIMHSSLDSRILHVNPKLCEILGYTREELLTMNLADIIPPENRNIELAKFLEPMLTGKIENFSSERPFIRKNGTIVWVNRHISLVRDVAGQPLYFLRTVEDITERKLAEQQIRRLNQLYSTLSQTNAAIVRIKDRDALFSRICQIAVDHNQFALSWIGLVDSATGLIRPAASAGTANGYLDGLQVSIDAGLSEGHGTSSVAVREGRAVVCNDIAQDPRLAPWHHKAKAAGLCAAVSLPLKTAGNTIGVLTLMAGETGFFDEALIKLLGEMAEDISYALDGMELEAKQRKTEEALLDSDEKFRELARNIPQLFWMTDAEQKSTIYASPAYEAISGRPVAELEAEPHAWLRTIHEDDRESVQRARKQRAPLGTYDVEYRVVHTDGSVRWIHDRAFPVRNARGDFYRIAGIAEDVTERKLAQEQLANLAHYDSLTGLPNRVLFNDRLRQAMAQARRNHWILGVLFLDLDRFKLVNDTLGHNKGDLLLKQVAARMVGNLRPTDTVGRLSGDEFAVILSEINTTQNAGYVAQKIIDALAAPFELEGSEVFVTASIGIALYPSDSENLDALLRDADAAMYGAKAAGRNNYQYYTAAMNERAQEKLNLETGLRRALTRKEFLLHYQPKIDIASGNISGLEALLRWQSPDHGLVSPGQFIPLLEETGLIVPVGEWVARAACAQLQAWQRAGLQPVPVAINLSARQLQQQGFVRTLEQALRDFDIDPELIHVEITESSLMENPEQAITVLQELKALGIRLEADDFGTGYSSLGYLKRFPLDALKIDRTFVDDLPHDEDDAVIARTVITLAHSLGLGVIAEGVETAEQLAFLDDNSCDEAQGYLIARPMPAEECAALLTGNLPLYRLHAAEPPQQLPPAVLIVDDDCADLEMTRRLLQKDGHSVITTTSTDEAFAMLAGNRVSIVITDHNMPGMSGVEFLRRVKLTHPDVMRIMLSGIDDFGTATSAINESEVHKFFVKGRDTEMLRREVKRKNRHASACCSQALDMARQPQGRPRRVAVD